MNSVERYKSIVFDNLNNIKHLDEIYDVNNLPATAAIKKKEEVKWQYGLLELLQLVFSRMRGVVTQTRNE